MSKLAFLLVWTETILDEFFAQLAFFFVLKGTWFGQRVIMISRRLRVNCRCRGQTGLVETFGIE